MHFIVNWERKTRGGHLYCGVVRFIAGSSVLPSPQLAHANRRYSVLLLKINLLTLRHNNYKIKLLAWGFESDGQWLGLLKIRPQLKAYNPNKVLSKSEQKPIPFYIFHQSGQSGKRRRFDLFFNDSQVRIASESCPSMGPSHGLQS